MVMTDSSGIPSTLRHPSASRFWSAIVFTGIATGIGSIFLTDLLEWVQRAVWGGTGLDLLDSVQRAPVWRHVVVLATAGVVTGAGQVLLRRLSSGNGIDTSAAIWFQAGRMPSIRTLGSAVLSVIVVGMGASLGREGAPKQAGAVFANFFADHLGLSDDQRRLLVASGAGAGMGSAYGVPVGGALFSLEVMRGVLALRFVLPALVTSFVAAGVAWLGLPNAPTYRVPEYSTSASVIVFASFAGPIAGLISVGYVRLIAWADRNKPSDWHRITAPIVALGIIGVISVWFPEVTGNGRDISQLTFLGFLPSAALAGSLLLLRPAATITCVRTGVPGGLFTPSLTIGALFGCLLGYIWNYLWPVASPGLFAIIGAGSVLAATTQGPVSTVVLLMEMTGRDRSFILPLLIGIATATLVSRTIEPRSIYEARLTDEQIRIRQQIRDQSLSTG
jgi:CIC family chloride channel protein